MLRLHHRGAITITGPADDLLVTDAGGRPPNGAAPDVRAYPGTTGQRGDWWWYTPFEPNRLPAHWWDRDNLSRVKAVLFDMDGTLVDSEKLWDVAIQKLYARFGGVLTPEVRAATVGGSAEGVMRIVYADLGLDPDPIEMAATADWLHDITGELFGAGLPWCDGARELLDALAEAAVPMALVTNTRRALTERALESIGRHYFQASVCGDEVPAGKPAPDPYRRAAMLLDLPPGACLAVEDSVTGAASAERAGCPVLVVPNDVEVPRSLRRRHVGSLAGLGVPELYGIFAELQSG